VDCQDSEDCNINILGPVLSLLRTRWVAWRRILSGCFLHDNNVDQDSPHAVNCVSDVPTSDGSTLGPGGTGPPNLAQAPNFFRVI